jgi:hypothetical protein
MGMTTTRSIQTLQHLLSKKPALLSQKLAWAIELHIAQLFVDEQKYARQKLPFLVQF